MQAPKLYVYTGVPFGSHPATLAWAVDVTSTTRPERKLVFVDAVSGQVADTLDRTEFAKNRTIYNANGSTTTGTFARGEGDPATGNRDVDDAYDWTGATYDYYASNFGRDSYDGAGRGARRASCTTASATRTRSGTGSRWSTATASRSTTSPRTSSPTR